MAQVRSFREISGKMPTSASTSDSTLVIIDAQNEYAFGNLRTENIDSTRPAIASLLSRYRANASPQNIVHILHAAPDGAPVFTPGTSLANEFGEVAAKDGEKVIYKKHPGSFTDTELGGYLEEIGTKKVVLVGYMAHVCVSTTARQAAERGLEVVVPREAVGDRNIPGVEAEKLVDVVLGELADSFGTVVGVESIL